MKRPNLYDRLKVIAILTMIVDHLGYLFLPEISWLRLTGRIAFPIFLFLVGFNLKYERKWNLLVRAIVLQIPIFVLHFGFGFGGWNLNILFGIVIGRAFLDLYTRLRILDDPLKIYPLIMTIIVAFVIHPLMANVIDYGSFIVLFPLMGFLFRKYSSRRIPILFYSLSVFVYLFIFTQMVFGFPVMQLYFLALIFTLLLCIFFFLGQGNRFLPIEEKIDVGVLFLSKNALLVYVFHLLAFGIVKMFLMRYGVV